MASPLSSARRWSLDCLVDALKSGQIGVIDAVEKTTGRKVQMVGRAIEGSTTTAFYPCAILMDPKLQQEYEVEK